MELNKFMDPDYEKLLEADIDRELKSLPELEAPRTLAPRVMRAIAARASAASHRRAWSSWPLALRLASLAALLALFGGLCYALWAVPQTAPVAGAVTECGRWLSWAGVVWRAVSSLPGIAYNILSHLDTRLLVGGIAMVALAYATCIALAAGSFRLARAQYRNRIL